MAALLVGSVVVGGGLEYVGLAVGDDPGFDVEGRGVGAEREGRVPVGAQRHGGRVGVERVVAGGVVGVRVRVRVREVRQRGGGGVGEGGGLAQAAVGAVAGERVHLRRAGRGAGGRVLVVRY